MTSALALALQQQPDMSGPLGALFGGTTLLVMLAVIAIFVVGMWKVFTKAGQPGWAVLIPIYNAYILLKIVGRPGWWLVLYLIPVVNLVVAAIVAMDVAKSFGYSAVFGFILLFLAAGIGYLILGFGSARYVGPSAAPRVSAAVA